MAGLARRQLTRINSYLPFELALVHGRAQSPGMPHTPEEIERARQHLRDGERHIRDQQKRIAWRRRHGLPVEQSERFLRTMEQIQEQFRWNSCAACAKS